MKRTLLLTAVVFTLLSAPAGAGPFKTDRPHKAIVFGGSVSEYYAGNYGQYLEFGCANLEVINRAEQKKGAPALYKKFEREILGNAELMAQLRGKTPWLIFQGGLNSVFSPEMANYHLARLFKRAHDAKFKVMAMTLPPWGADDDHRFDGFDGVRTLRATWLMNDFFLGKLTPDKALGRRARNHPHEWMRGELPTISVNIYDSSMRDSKAPLRSEKAMEAAFGSSRYRKDTANKARLIAEARAVPRYYLKKEYHAFNHYHPNSPGHRIMATEACKRAPAAWGCDCKRIARAVFARGQVRDP